MAQSGPQKGRKQHASRLRAVVSIPGCHNVHSRLSLTPEIQSFPKRGWWNARIPVVPEELKTVAGIWRDKAHEQEAYEQGPLHDWVMTHWESVEWGRRHAWEVFLFVTPRLMKSLRAAASTAVANIVMPSRQLDPEALKKNVLEKAAAVGLSKIGVARFDPKYMFSEHQGKEQGDRVIVCVLEQNWEATQTIPSVRAERAAFSCYSALHQMMVELAEHLHSLGYLARVFPLPGAFMTIHYAVEAGLGQLGMNGQLLTPEAGSRCRLAVLSTNAPLPFDAPVDYGLHKICDLCQICARRCPSGAIPLKRTTFRGITKSKLNTARCWPVVAQEEECGICQKVCPVQRYGLNAILGEYARTGQILGKHSDELEGYHFQGRHYSAEEHPKLSAEYFAPPGFQFDPSRKKPAADGGTPFSVV